MRDYRWFFAAIFVLMVVLIMSVWMKSSHSVDKRSNITINVIMPDNFYVDEDEGVLEEMDKEGADVGVN